MELRQVYPVRNIEGQSAALDSPLTLLFEALKSFSFVSVENDCGMDPVRALLAKDSTSSECAVETWVGIVRRGKRKESLDLHYCARVLLARCHLHHSASQRKRSMRYGDSVRSSHLLYTGCLVESTYQVTKLTKGLTRINIRLSQTLTSDGMVPERWL